MLPYVIGVAKEKRELRAVLLDASGEVLGRERTDLPELQDQGTTAYAQTLPVVAGSVAEQAGVALEQVQAIAQTIRAQRHSPPSPPPLEPWPHLPLTLVSHAAATLVGGARTHQGITLLSGTELLAYGENGPEKQARAGGWGYLLDQGSDYALAGEALAAVMRAVDCGRPHSTILTALMLQALGLDEPSEIPSWLYAPSRCPSEVAALASVVLAAAQEADPLAVEIVARGADALAEAAQAVARQLELQGEPFPVVLSGDLLTTNIFYRELVAQAVLTRLPQAYPTPPQADATVGAALLALESLGYPSCQSSETQVMPGRPRSSEQTNVLTRDLDLRTTRQIVGLMHVEDRRAVSAVGDVLPEIVAAVDAIAARVREGGRLIYVGGGTSGRLGVLDASECPATFNAPPEQVVAVMAGGPEALFCYGERDEDDVPAGQQALRELNVGSLDSVVGITASGSTPFTVGALTEAARQGALTIALVCNLPAPLAELADYVIAPLVGPEALSGSTRLKAGTAQKLVLNMLSTAVMVRLGKTYGNLMVDVRQDNAKLQGRARRIVARICNVSQEAAAAALERTHGDVKDAALCLLTGVSPEDAKAHLEQSSGVLRVALKTFSPPDAGSPSRR